MNQRFSFVSKCPRCNCNRVIETYARGDLLWLLELGHPIEARCGKCKVHWSIGPEARVQIGRLVAASLLAR